MSNHGNLGVGNQHILENWSYADSAAREAATGFVAADIGKVAYQQSDGTYWRLTAVTPTWSQIGGGSNVSIVETAVSAEDANAITVEFQVKVNGDNATEPYCFRMWLTSNNTTFALSGTAADGGFSAADGSVVEEITAGLSMWYLSDDSGVITFDVSHSGTLSCYLAILLPDGSIFASSQLSFT